MQRGACGVLRASDRLGDGGVAKPADEAQHQGGSLLGREGLDGSEEDGASGVVVDVGGGWPGERPGGEAPEASCPGTERPLAVEPEARERLRRVSGVIAPVGSAGEHAGDRFLREVLGLVSVGAERPCPEAEDVDE